MKETDEFVKKANGEASLQNAKGLDQRLEAMVSELLGSEATLDGEAETIAVSALANDGSTKTSRKEAREAEIESLIERMIFSADTFAQYSH